MYRKEGLKTTSIAQFTTHSQLADFLKSGLPMCQQFDKEIYGSDSIDVETIHGHNTIEKFGTRLWGGRFRNIETYSDHGKPTNVYIEYQDAAYTLNLSIEEAVQDEKNNSAVSKVIYDKIKLGFRDENRLYEAGEVVYDNANQNALVSAVSRIEVKNNKLASVSVVTKLSDGLTEVVVADKDIPEDFDSSLMYNGALTFREYLLKATDAKKFYADKDWKPIDYFMANPVFEGQRYEGAEHLEHSGRFLNPAHIASEYIEGRMPLTMDINQDLSENPAEQ